jgi:SAM-dependent methyltransferase
MNIRMIKEKAAVLLAEPVFVFDARRRFKPFIRPSDHILDVGALSSPLTKGLPNRVTAIDIPPDDNAFGFGPKTVRKLEKRPNIEYRVMDAQRLDFPDDEFDVVLMTEVLEHIPDDRKAASEILRVLKPGGVLLLTVPNLERVPLSAGIREHLRHYTKEDLRLLFGGQEILSLKDRLKCNEFVWGSRVISRYNEKKNRFILPLLPFEALLKLALSYVWIPVSERILTLKPGYNLVLILRKRKPQHSNNAAEERP